MRHLSDRERNEILAFADVYRSRQELQERYGISRRMLCHYRKGLPKNHKSDELKVEAALYYLVNGNIAACAKKFGVSIFTISQWHRGRHMTEDARQMLEIGRELLAMKAKRAANLCVDAVTPDVFTEASIGEIASAFKRFVEAADRLEDRPPPADMFAALPAEEKLARINAIINEARLAKAQAEEAKPLLIGAPEGKTYRREDDGTLTEVA